MTLSVVLRYSLCSSVSGRRRTKSKLDLEMHDHLLPELSGELGVSVTDDGFTESMKVECALVKLICCLHGINCGLCSDEEIHLGQIAHWH